MTDRLDTLTEHALTTNKRLEDMEKTLLIMGASVCVIGFCTFLMVNKRANV